MIRTILRAAGALLGIALLAATVWLVNLVAFRPFSLDLFYEKAFVTFVLENPELLTSIGIAEQFGYRRHNAHLDDVSVAKVERDFAQWRVYLADLKVPADVSVAGFDDVPAASAVTPPLTTVRQPLEDIGTRAVAELVSLIGGAPGGPSRIELPTRLVVRDSTGPAPSI